MKLKALFLALAVAGAGASFALADDSGGSTTTGTNATTGLDDHERRLSPVPPERDARLGLGLVLLGHRQEGQQRRQVLGRLGRDGRRHRRHPGLLERPWHPDRPERGRQRQGERQALRHRPDREQGAGARPEAGARGAFGQGVQGELRARQVVATSTARSTSNNRHVRGLAPRLRCQALFFGPRPPREGWSCYLSPVGPAGSSPSLRLEGHLL